MIAQKLAERYAKALFEIAGEGLRESFLNQLEGISSLMKAHPDFLSVMLSPAVAKTIKVNVLKHISEEKFDSSLLRFLQYLIEKNRFKYLPDIISEYERKILQAKGSIKLKMITSVPAGPKEKEVLKTRMEQSTGKKVVLEETVNPSIKGGGILVFGNHIYDSSIKAKLERLRNHLISRYS